MMRQTRRAALLVTLAMALACSDGTPARDGSTGSTGGTLGGPQPNGTGGILPNGNDTLPVTVDRVACASSADCYSGFECTNAVCTFPGDPNATAGAAVALVFTAPPLDATAGSNLDVVTVAFVDAFQNVVTGPAGQMDLSLQSDSVALQGVVSAPATAGATSFDGLIVPSAGTYQMHASVGALQASSPNFTIHAVAWAPLTGAAAGWGAIGSAPGIMWFAKGSNLAVSLDAGATLTPLVGNMPTLFDIGADPTNPNRLWAWGTHDGFSIEALASTDAGQTWTSGTQGPAVMAFDLTHPGRFYTFSNYGGGDSILRRTDDGGSTFTQAYPNAANFAALMVTADGSVMGALGNTQLAISHNLGLTWSVQNPNLSGEILGSSEAIRSLLADPADANTLLLGTSGIPNSHARLFVSHDSGATWHVRGPQLLDNWPRQLLACTGNGQSVLYALAADVRRRLIASHDHGDTWVAAGWGLTVPQAPYLTLLCAPGDPNHVFVTAGMAQQAQETLTGGK